ncbi:hypothetical protein NIES2111_32760 [Nostoc sp. NIES-2111]|nr:hypothetical protein NIES2111_32760 [Nostoc sp. NIES-2111]
MSYRNIQIHNSKKRLKLHPEDQNWLKVNSYKNIGWENVIHLYEKIEEFFNKYQVEDLTLEELFLEADRIGNKYLSSQEIADFNQTLAIEVNEISEEIDKQFPDTEIEFIDFSKKNQKKHMLSRKRSF